MLPSVYQSLDQIKPAPQTCILIQRLSGSGHTARRTEAHSLLRELVARRRGVSVGQISLRHTPGQPPRLPDASADSPSSFSISYAGDWIALGWRPDGAIGIDLAEIVLPPDWRELTALFFSPTQRGRLAQMTDAQRPAQFARCWAELEARGKCCALGLQEWSAAYANTLGRAAVDWLDAPSGMVLCLAQSLPI